MVFGENAGRRLLKTASIQENIAHINQRHLAFQEKIKVHPSVLTTRVLGVIFALEIQSNENEQYYGNMRNKLYNFFIENGVVLRPVGNIVYILPPYIMNDRQLDKIYQTIESAIDYVTA